MISMQATGAAAIPTAEVGNSKICEVWRADAVWVGAFPRQRAPPGSEGGLPLGGSQ